MTMKLFPILLLAIVLSCLCVAGLPTIAEGGARRSGLESLLPAASRKARHDVEDEESQSHEKENKANVVCNDTLANNTTVACKTSDVQTDTGSLGDKLEHLIFDNKSVIVRALIVFGSITAIVLVYVSFRCIRRHRQQSKSRKYGLISMPDDKLELRPLDEDDDDDEDMTVFDRTKPRNLKSASGNQPKKPLVKRPR
jgi:hypothetical protein